MDYLQNPLFLLPTITGITLIITALITSKYPPKKINNIYGYRTKSSMKSDERWNFSQKFSTNLMYKYGILLTIVGIIGYFTSFSIITSAILSTISIIGMVWAVVYTTEKAINEKFGKSD